MMKKFFHSLNKEELFEKITLQTPYCHKSKDCYLVILPIQNGLKELFPYLKPQVKALFSDENSLIFKWFFRDKFFKVSLSDEELKFGLVSDKEEAKEVLSALIDYLKELEERAKDIEPDYKPVKRPPALEIYKFLPKTNCKACGELTCLAFATKISIGEAEPEDCPYLKEESLISLRRLLE